MKPGPGAALAAVVASAACLLGASGAGLGTLEVVERWSLDWRFRARGAQAPSGEVALVVFDDATVARAPQVFSHRAGWASVITAVADAGAHVIGVDAVFDEPERLLGASLQQRVEAWATNLSPDGGVERALLTDIAAELEGDAQLAGAVQRAGNVVLIVSASDQADAGLDLAALSRGRYGQSSPGARPVSAVAALQGSQAAITRAAKGLGFANATEDETRTVRRLRFALRVDEALYLPFTVPLVAFARDVSRGRLAYLGAEQQVRIGELAVSLDDDAIWLNYLGPAGTFPTFSAADVLEGRLPPGALAGKVVLLGVTRSGYDVIRTPFSAMPGVEGQATAVDNVLRGATLRRSGRLVDALVTVALGLLVAALFLSRRLGPVLQVSVAGGLLTAWLGGSLLAFTRAGLWLPWVTPTLCVVASLGAGLVLAYRSENRQRRHLRNAFHHYVGKDVLDELLERPDTFTLGGEKRAVTVLFSDIRDFTTLSERLAPTELVTFLNTYLSPMTQAVLAEGGLLDKYIGDAVMGVFGAPVPRVHHADEALRCVLAMHRELEALNAGPIKALGLEVAIGVGINSGEVVAGNMGSAERFDYTVVGDAVNLASRLEGVSKVYGVFCLVGEATRRACSDAFTFRELDQVQVKGKHEAVAVYELLAGPGRVVSTRSHLDQWALGLAAFREGRLPEARVAFKEFAAHNAGDLTVRRYLDRLAELPEHAPAGFNAVTAFKSK